ncbi:type I pantothenate kinase [Ferroplasma sp.]|uniref:type I pantothenate kinase n=1 Tax=Ferroplasma sp. TaxID=2591003 RepID=UPI00307EC99A
MNASDIYGREMSSSLYLKFNRNEWAKRRGNLDIKMSDNDIKGIVALNDKITPSEISDFYLPITRLLQLSINNNKKLYRERNDFIGINPEKVPFIIGVTGSVAVGKSTTSRLLKTLLDRINPEYNIYIVSTDNFLKSNATLQKENRLERKGFPESFDIQALLNFLVDIKAGKNHIEIPVYSHLKYDVLPEKQEITNPDILILEGLNILQVNKLGRQNEIYVSDFLDFSIFIDANVEYIKEWFIQRFFILMDTAFRDRNSYFQKYSQLGKEEAIKLASSIWDNINGKNYLENIIKTRYRAELIIEKGKNHNIENIMLKKL